ncbi:MAG: hypothetical protein AAGI22_00175 [Planctomycetota bacterium]
MRSPRPANTQRSERPFGAGTTALVDVTFLVLIFTMCTTQFRTLESRLAADLPKGVGFLEPAVIGPLDVVVMVASFGPPGSTPADCEAPSYSSTDTPRAMSYRVGPRRLASLVDVDRELRRHFERTPERRVIIDPRVDTTHQDVVTVYDMVLAIGFEDVSFGAPRER